MTSSASSPFELLDVKVKPVPKALIADNWPDGGFVRYMLVDLMKESDLHTHTQRVGIAAHIELAQDSWLSDFGPGHSSRIGTVTAVVRVHEADIAVEPQPYSKAVWFACEQLNPMLDTFSTLFGIEQGIDIHVEHRLRPVERLLHNLIMPRSLKATLKNQPWNLI